MAKRIPFTTTLDDEIVKSLKREAFDTGQGVNDILEELFRNRNVKTEAATITRIVTSPQDVKQLDLKAKKDNGTLVRDFSKNAQTGKKVRT